ncbi:hypothetical protein [Streptomyces sp. NPDC097619]|uniref:hypothetical protein n=1 Tax=Streptomyces sp. NPDC097619 TaxID=3157228 RepID=UPI0033278E73
MLPEAAPAAPTLQGTLLTDASRLLTDIRGDLHALTLTPTTDAGARPRIEVRPR